MDIISNIINIISILLILIIKEALRMNDPKFNFKAYLRRGESYSRRARYREAINDFSKALKLEPNNKEAENFLIKAQQNYLDVEGELAEKIDIKIKESNKPSKPKKKMLIKEVDEIKDDDILLNTEKSLDSDNKKIEDTVTNKVNIYDDNKNNENMNISNASVNENENINNNNEDEMNTLNKKVTIKEINDNSTDLEIKKAEKSSKKKIIIEKINDESSESNINIINEKIDSNLSKFENNDDAHFEKSKIEEIKDETNFDKNKIEEIKNKVNFVKSKNEEIKKEEIKKEEIAENKDKIVETVKEEPIETKEQNEIKEENIINQPKTELEPQKIENKEIPEQIEKPEEKKEEIKTETEENKNLENVPTEQKQDEEKNKEEKKDDLNPIKGSECGENIQKKEIKEIKEEILEKDKEILNNYKLEETKIKFDISEYIFNILIQETVDILDNIQNGRKYLKYDFNSSIFQNDDDMVEIYNNNYGDSEDDIII